MRVRVRPINVNGCPQFASERDLRPAFVGELKVAEERRQELGRVTVTARVIDTVDPARVALLELLDATLLWVHEGRMRLRGFEVLGKTQFAQTWDVEVA